MVKYKISSKMDTQYYNNVEFDTTCSVCLEKGFEDISRQCKNCNVMVCFPM